MLQPKMSAMTDTVECPLCFLDFPEDGITNHAAQCVCLEAGSALTAGCFNSELAFFPNSMALCRIRMTVIQAMARMAWRTKYDATPIAIGSKRCLVLTERNYST
jgi:hypothetical protein